MVFKKISVSKLNTTVFVIKFFHEKYLLLLFIITPLSCFGQVAQMKSYQFDNGYQIKQGDFIKLGKPKDGDNYTYIFHEKTFAGKREYLNFKVFDSFKIQKLLRFEHEPPVVHAIILNDDEKFSIDLVKAIESRELLIEEKYVHGLNYQFNVDDITLKNGLPYYERVVDLDIPADKNSLYRAAKQTFIKVFKDANEVLQYQNQDEGELIGKGFSLSSFLDELGFPQSYKMWFLCKISVKEGRYRIQVYEYDVKLIRGIEEYSHSIVQQLDNYSNGSKTKSRVAKRFLESFHIENNSFIKAIEDNMKQSLYEVKDDEW